MQWIAEPRLSLLTPMVDLAREAVKLNPASAANWIALAGALSQAGDLAEADEQLEEAVRRFPQDIDLRIWQARILTRLGEYENAVAAADAALTLQPANAAASRLRYAALVKSGETEKAVASLDRSDRPFVAARADALFKSGAFDELVTECKRCLARHPGHTGATFYLAMALAKLQRAEEARAALSLDRYIAIGKLATPAAYGSELDFLGRLADEIARNPSLAADPRGKATRQGQQTRQLRRADATAIEALMAEIKKAVAAYAAALPSGDGIAKARPPWASLKAWAVISGAEGHQQSHIHPKGWLSGVFYVAGVRVAGEAAYRGPLVLGAPGEQLGLDDAPWGTREIEPIPGRIVLFPSYVPHATLPPQVEGQRIVIAFDVVGQPAPA